VPRTSSSTPCLPLLISSPPDSAHAPPPRTPPSPRTRHPLRCTTAALTCRLTPRCTTAARVSRRRPPHRAPAPRVASRCTSSSASNAAADYALRRYMGHVVPIRTRAAAPSQPGADDTRGHSTLPVSSSTHTVPPCTPFVSTIRLIILTLTKEDCRCRRRHHRLLSESGNTAILPGNSEFQGRCRACRVLCVHSQSSHSYNVDS
jgi:hypothetical protein